MSQFVKNKPMDIQKRCKLTVAADGNFRNDWVECSLSGRVSQRLGETGVAPISSPGISCLSSVA